MFKPKRTKQENIAAAVPGIPRPSQTVINHAPSEAGKIFAWAIVVVGGGVIGWWFLSYLVREGFGYRNPVQAIAWFLFISVGLVVLSFFFSSVVTRNFMLFLEHRERIEAIRAEAARHQALTAGAPAPPAKRLTAEQMRLYENLALVMQKAYQDLADSKGIGYEGGSDRRPWSTRPVLAMEPPRYGKMPHSKAGDIRKWLVDHNVIIGSPQDDQINTESYPAFADFLALLKEEFDMPVVVRTNKALPFSTGGGYTFTGFE